MPDFLNICGPVLADTAYVQNKLVARDVAITLPEVSFMTAEIQAMGTHSISIPQLLEDMEAAITKIGVDLGLSSMIKPEPLPLEVRWAQNVTDVNGASRAAGCKAFLRGTCRKIPGIGLNVGEASESEIPYGLTRYQLFVDGEEVFCFDRLNGICRIGGTDYMQNINALL